MYLNHGSWLDTLYATHNRLGTYAVTGTSDLNPIDLSYNNLTRVDLLSSEITDIKLNKNNIDRLRFDNINNITTSTFDARNNPNLWCIAFARVTDANYAKTAWTNVDNAGVDYSDLNCCFPIWLNNREVERKRAINIFPNPTIEDIYRLRSILFFLSSTGLQQYRTLVARAGSRTNTTAPSHSSKGSRCLLSCGANSTRSTRFCSTQKTLSRYFYLCANGGFMR